MSFPRIAISMLSLVLIPALPAGAVLVYSNDFETSAGSEWSDTSRSTTPGTAQHPADKFLGHFNNGNVTLTLNNLPAHTDVTVTFDLFIIKSWDGNSTTNGPDFWGIDADVYPEKEWDYATTFSNWPPNHQSYPQEYIDGNNHGDYEGQYGASEKNTLGYDFNGDILDSVYHFVVDFSHSTGTLEVTFGALGLQPIGDESWGLDGVMVDVIPEPATLALLGFGGVILLRHRRGSAGT